MSTPDSSPVGTTHIKPLDAVEQRLHDFARHYEQIAKPFDWKFTRQDLNQLLDRLDNDQPCQLAA